MQCYQLLDIHIVSLPDIGQTANNNSMEWMSYYLEIEGDIALVVA